MNIKLKLMTAAAVGTTLVALIAPATFASTNGVTIMGGGAFSHQKAVVINKTHNKVMQGNLTFAGTVVKNGANTGNNHSGFNVGGTNSINTGSATNNTTVTVGGGTNVNTGSCGCGGADSSTVAITGGGAFSSNEVVIVNKDSSTVTQLNGTVALTSVHSHANTGDNSTGFNVGTGSSITTGDATNNTTVTVTGSENVNGSL